MCGRLLEAEELLGLACGRCDKIVGDVEVEMAFLGGGRMFTEPPGECRAYGISDGRGGGAAGAVRADRGADSAVWCATAVGATGLSVCQADKPCAKAAIHPVSW